MPRAQITRNHLTIDFTMGPSARIPSVYRIFCELTGLIGHDAEQFLAPDAEFRPRQSL